MERDINPTKPKKYDLLDRELWTSPDSGPLAEALRATREEIDTVLGDLKEEAKEVEVLDFLPIFAQRALKKHRKKSFK